MLSDSNDANPIATLFEMQRRLIGITFPEGVFFAREFLNLRRQRSEEFPEALLCPADHGRSSSLPARISSRTSSRSGRNRPLSAKSSSIWRSQAAFSRSRMKAANSANSPEESEPTASLISARLIMNHSCEGICWQRIWKAKSGTGFTSHSVDLVSGQVEVLGTQLEEVTE